MSNDKTCASSCVHNPTQPAETNWQFEDETPDIVRTYFNAVGIMDWLPEDDFEPSFSKRFGFDATEYLDATKGEHWEKYAASVKAGNLELALAVRSQFDGTRFEEYFSWLTETDLPKPSRVLDVGCDIGITTCFYATLYPQATIIGIDSSRAAIECAKNLAAKLHLTNVEFVEGDICHLPEGLKEQRFDLISSVFVADRMCFDTYTPRCVEEVTDQMVDEGVEYAQALADLLADDRSRLVSFENMFSPHHLAVWLLTLREAGIHVPSSSLDLLWFDVKEYDCYEFLPVLIGSKQVAEPPTAEEIRSLWTGGLDEIPDQEVYTDIEAESILMATEPKELCHSIFNDSDDDDELSETELWATDSHVLVFKYSHFDRKLARLPAEDPKRHIELLMEMFDEKKNA